MEADERVAPSPEHRCRRCYDVKARPDIAGVTFVGVGSAIGSGGLGDTSFALHRRAMLGRDCAGIYEIGITTLERDYRRSGQGGVSTDYVLFRRFSSWSPEACVVPGSHILEGRCWDVWAVRIRDASGRLISMDLPGAVDSGTVDSSDEDAGQ
jgi:hypothetical protein